VHAILASNGAASAAAGRPNLRAYLAGAGATTSLIAASFVAFLALATLVAFNGIPFGLGGGDVDEVPVAQPATGGQSLDPAVVALLSGASGAEATQGGAAAGPGGGSPGAGDGASPRGGSDQTGDGVAGGGGSAPTGQAPGSAGGGTGSGSSAGSAGGGSGALGGTVGSVEESTGSLGVDLPLQETTQGITEPADGTLNQTLNDAGGVADKPKLGDEVASGTNDLTGSLLP
jgi:hypothetical protein